MIVMELQVPTSRHGDDKCLEDLCTGPSNWLISEPVSHLSMSLNKYLHCLLSHSLPTTEPARAGARLFPESSLRETEHQPSTMTGRHISPHPDQPSTMTGRHISTHPGQPSTMTGRHISTHPDQPSTSQPNLDTGFPSRCHRSSQKAQSPDNRFHQSATFTAIKSRHIPVRMMVLCLLILTLCSGQAIARSVGICRGVPCANGGTLLVDNSVWGHCRCRCPARFLGPYCQYQVAEKRSSEIVTNTDNRRLGRSDALERIRVRLLELSQRIALTQISRELTTLGDQEVPDNNSELPSEEEIGSRIEGPDTSMTSYQSARARRSWDQELDRT